MARPSWSAGYVSDTPYTLGFYREMGPEHLAFAAVLNGHVLRLKPGLRYCELGCGRGYGTLLHAAANPDREFVGIDFSPAHIHEARQLAERARIDNVRFIEASFAEVADGLVESIGEFDIVALHGVFTWIGDDAVRDVQRVLRRYLKPGGFCYVSYNTLPGWAQTMPLQRLIREVAVRTPGDSLRAFAVAREVLGCLEAADAGFLKQNAGARSRIARFAQHSPHYLVHEYLNECWQPLYVTEMMAIMAEAKLDYVGSASVIRNRVEFNVPDGVRQIFDNAPDPGMRELLKDFVASRQFRRDIYVKGAMQPAAAELDAAFGEVMLAQVAEIDAGREEWKIPIGAARPEPRAIATVLEVLADGPAPISAIRAHYERQGLNRSDLPGVLEILVEDGVLHTCRSDFASVDRAPAARLNRAVLELALGQDTHRYLAAPILGSAVPANYSDRILALLLLEETPAAPVTVQAAHEMLGRHGKHVSEQGKVLEDVAAAQEKLSSMLQDLRAKRLPHWRALGIGVA